MQLHIETLGDEELWLALGLLVARSTEDALHGAAERARERTRQRFLSAGKLWGPTWPPPKKPRPGGGLLIRSGRLFRSLTDPRDSDHVEQILAGPGAEVVLLFGTTVPYAAFIHFGTRSLPVRRLLTPEILTG